MFDWSSLPWGDIFKFGGSMFGALGEAGAGRKAGRQSTPNPYGVGGPAGGMQFDPRTGQIMMSMAQNPFASMFNSLGASGLANAAVAPGSFMYGANPELAAAYKGTFGQGLDRNIKSQLNLLRDAAAPEENRQRLGLDDTLFSRGMTGTSGGAEQERAQLEAFNQADLQRQLAAVGMGRQEANDRFQNAFSTIGQGMQGQRQNFDIGMGAFNGMQGLFQNMLNQNQFGSMGMQGAMPWQAAMYGAQSSQAPWQAGFNWLNQSGIFDRMNGWGDARTPPIQPNPPRGPGSYDPSTYG